MKHPYPLTHLGDGELLSNNEAIWRRRRHCTAEGLAHLAEIDERRLYLPAAYHTMQSFCIHELRFTPDEAEKRVTAARVARQYPVVFTLIAEGQLHLTGVLILAPRLAPVNAEELLAVAADQTLQEIRLLLAKRFPRPDLAVQEPPSGDQLDLAASDSPAPERVEMIPEEPAPTPGSPARVMPLSPGRFGVQFTMSQKARDHYEYSRALLSHELPRADLATVSELAYAALSERLEKKKLGAARKPRSGARSAIDRRHIPTATRRQVYERDGGRCTFTSAAGKRCPATRLLEFDHIDEFARGGEATADNLRIRCRAHNQYAAECSFGKGFMDHKRREARERSAANSLRAGSPPAPERVDSRTPGERTNGDRGAPEPAGAGVGARTNGQARVVESTADDRDVTPWLRRLGVRASEARRMAEICETTMPNASLEERVKRALSYLAPRQR